MVIQVVAVDDGKLASKLVFYAQSTGTVISGRRLMMEARGVV